MEKNIKESNNLDESVATGHATMETDMKVKAKPFGTKIHWIDALNWCD